MTRTINDAKTKKSDATACSNTIGEGNRVATTSFTMSGALTQYEIVNELAPKRDWNVVVGSELNDIESLTPSKDKDLVLEKETLAPEPSAAALAEASVLDKD